MISASVHHTLWSMLWRDPKSIIRSIDRSRWNLSVSERTNRSRWFCVDERKAMVGNSFRRYFNHLSRLSRGIKSERMVMDGEQKRRFSYRFYSGEEWVSYFCPMLKPLLPPVGIDNREGHEHPALRWWYPKHQRLSWIHDRMFSEIVHPLRQLHHCPGRCCSTFDEDNFQMESIDENPFVIYRWDSCIFEDILTSFNIVH